jgi:hypothetical protein
MKVQNLTKTVFVALVSISLNKAVQNAQPSFRHFSVVFQDHEVPHFVVSSALSGRVLIENPPYDAVDKDKTRQLGFPQKQGKK